MNSTIEVVSPLRQRFLDEMRMRKLSPKTQGGYLCAVVHDHLAELYMAVVLRDQGWDIKYIKAATNICILAEHARSMWHSEKRAVEAYRRHAKKVHKKCVLGVSQLQTYY